jgi:hypothetical protein
VSIIGAHIMPSTAGVTPAERNAARSKAVQRGRGSHSRDDDLVTVEIEAAEAARKLEGNDQEEAHEDRQAHQHYTPGGRVRRPTPRTLDIQG